MMQRSMTNSAKKCDLPDPRPPYAPKYLASESSGTKPLGVSICRVGDDSFNA
jgi:hypothetical protein